MKKYIFAAFIVWLVNSNPVLAQSGVEQELVALIENLDSYAANFQQIVAEDDGFVLDENSGVMSFEKPNRLYWQVLEPFPNLLVSNGEEVYFYDPDLEQVTIRRWSADPAQNPMAVFLNASELNNYYRIEQTDGIFLLTPLDQSSNFSSIQLEFFRSKPVSMMFADQLGQITRISFSDLEQGAIPEQPYTFSVPDNTDIIDDR